MAGNVTAGTLRIIQKPVGLRLPKDKKDALSIQQLLAAAGEEVAVDGDWGDGSQTALMNWQKRRLTDATAGTFPGGRAQEVLTVDSPVLELLAEEAGVLMPLQGEKGIAAVDELHDWLVDKKVQYQTGAESGGGNRAVWGLFSNRKLAIETAGINKALDCAPILLDCTTYVNMMLGLYFDGNLHGKYAAGVKETGGGSAATEHIGKTRWGFELIYREADGKKLNFHKTADEILAAAKTREGKLFHLEVGGSVKGVSGFVTHMALMLGETVYECTTKQPAAACLRRPLSEFMANKGGSIIYLFAEK